MAKFTELILPDKLNEYVNKLHWIACLDWGWTEGFSLSFTTPYNIVFVYSETIEEELFPQTVENLQYLMKRFKNLSIVADPAGAAKSLIETLRHTYGIPIIGADKVDKFTAISNFNQDASLGLIKVFNLLNTEHPEESDIVQKCNNLVWIENPKTGIKSEGPDNHVTDTMLYAWRYWKKNYYRKKIAVKKESPENIERKKVEQFIEQQRDKFRNKPKMGWRRT